MRRREFVGLLGAAAAWPVAGHSQQQRKLPTIGFLGASAASTQAPWTAAFVQRLRELGWVEGRTIAIEYRFARGATIGAGGNANTSLMGLPTTAAGKSSAGPPTGLNTA